MKKFRLVISAAALITVLSTPGYTFLGGRDLTCGESACIGCAVLIIIPIQAIDNFIDAISDSRTVSIDINGTKGVFQKNSIKRKDKKNRTIYSGNLVKPAEVTVQNRKILINPGLVTFHEKGTVNIFKGKGLFLTVNLNHLSKSMNRGISSIQYWQMKKQWI